MTAGNRVSEKSSPCYYFHFGLIVTGESEREHLPKLFKSLMETGVCTFQVIRFTGQRSPITSAKRKLDMVGSGKRIPDKDAVEIGFPARRHLALGQCHSVILVDDLEHDRQAQAQQVFDRYRSILDAVLTGEQMRRAAVHFLVNMLEAYYLADAGAINAVLDLDPPLKDYPKDVETIRNPKGYIRERYPAFDEIEDGGKILDLIDVERVLSRPDTCAWLRTLFAWCVKVLEQYPDHASFPVTRVQLDHF